MQDLKQQVYAINAQLLSQAMTNLVARNATAAVIIGLNETGQMFIYSNDAIPPPQLFELLRAAGDAVQNQESGKIILLNPNNRAQG